jgi:hypothetical protein
MAARRPKTGEKRVTNQPLKIDRLSPEVHHTILLLRNAKGKTWQEIEDLSALPVKEGGFVDWESLPTPVLELFPNMRLPHSNLHRWYDIRVRQVRSETMQRAAQAQEIAEAFAKSNMAHGNEAVLNASRAVLMGFLTEDATERGRLNATKGLLKLAEVMQKARTNDIRERKVSVEEQALQLKLDEIKRKAASVIKAVEGEEAGTAAPMSREDVLKAVREIYGVA